LTLVVDASVAIAWCLHDETSDYADDVLSKLGVEDAVVPHHWALEVANGLLAAERRSRIDESELQYLVEMLLSLPIAPEPIARNRDLTATLRLARGHNLTTYDAAYLELGQRIGAPIATLDRSLASAAREAGAGHWAS
jgi:predicted nucleic acid-binding protein